MALVDVTKPVIINATTSIVRESPDHLRRVCLISLGWSILQEGEAKEIFKYDYQNYCRAYSEIQKKCVSYFGQANNKSLILLELGIQSGTPLESSFFVLKDYCDTLSGFSFGSYLKWVYDTNWDQKAAQETKDLLIQFYNYYSPGEPFNEESYENWAQLNQYDEGEPLTMMTYMNAVFPHDWEVTYLNWLYAENESFKVAVEDEDKLMQYVTSLNNTPFDAENYSIYLEEHGTKDSDYSSKVKAINDFVTNSELPCYIFILPDGMGNYELLQAELFALYGQLNQPVYFFLDYNGQAESVEISNHYEQVKDQKSAALFLNNTEGQSLSALSAGMFASYKFDLSQTNPASPFNYKRLDGVKFSPLPLPIKQNLIQLSVNFVDQVANQIVLLNGRYGDTFAIDYRYQWDLTSFRVETDLKSLILNGVNNPIYVIKYNQNGIDILQARVKSSLNAMIELGAVTEYAASINAATGDLINVGDITCIGFREYITNNPEDYENEIYGGISFYLRIGKYIRQVILNITLG